MYLLSKTSICTWDQGRPSNGGTLLRGSAPGSTSSLVDLSFTVVSSRLDPTPQYARLELPSRLKVQKLRDQSEKEGTELVRSWYGLSTLGYGLPGGGVENIGLK